MTLGERAVEKTLPANAEAERAVLGSLLIDAEAISEIASFLKPEDFYRERHGVIYAARLELYERREPGDFVTLVDELRRRGQLETVGGASYLADLVNDVLRRPYRERFSIIVNELGAAVAGNAKNLNDAIRRAAPGLRGGLRVRGRADGEVQQRQQHQHRVAMLEEVRVGGDPSLDLVCVHAEGRLRRRGQMLDGVGEIEDADRIGAVVVDTALEPGTPVGHRDHRARRCHATALRFHDGQARKGFGIRQA